MKKDNSTIAQKLAIRQAALARLKKPGPVLETHGGNGRLFERLYHAMPGVVCEKDPTKACALARQRPAWRVYECDCAAALADGLARDVPFCLVDVDPYGSPFEVIEALFATPRAWAPEVQLVVNDGLRHKAKLGSAWQAHVLRGAVKKHGNDLYPIYLRVAREMVEGLVARSGFSVAQWTGYHCGHNGDMTHYLATLTRGEAAGKDQ